MVFYVESSRLNVYFFHSSPATDLSHNFGSIDSAIRTMAFKVSTFSAFLLASLSVVVAFAPPAARVSTTSSSSPFVVRNGSFRGQSRSSTSSTLFMSGGAQLPPVSLSSYILLSDDIALRDETFILNNCIVIVYLTHCRLPRYHVIFLKNNFIAQPIRNRTCSHRVPK